MEGGPVIVFGKEIGASAPQLARSASVLVTAPRENSGRVRRRRRALVPGRRARRPPSQASTRTPSAASSVIGGGNDQFVYRCLQELNGRQRERARQILALRESTRQSEADTGGTLRMEQILATSSRCDDQVLRTVAKGRDWRRRFESRYPDTADVEANVERMEAARSKAKLGKCTGVVQEFRNGKVVGETQPPDSRAVATAALERFAEEDRRQQEVDLRLVKDTHVRCNAFSRHGRRKAKLAKARAARRRWKEDMSIGAFALMEERLGVEVA